MIFQKGEFDKKLGFSICEFLDKMWNFAPACHIKFGFITGMHPQPVQYASLNGVKLAENPSD